MKEKTTLFVMEMLRIIYQSLCQKNKMDILTQRRVSDIIKELICWIINVNVFSKGRGGRMREIKLAISKDIIEKAKELMKTLLK
jgi:Cdc6-like AAA superfamily ATPase